MRLLVLAMQTTCSIGSVFWPTWAPTTPTLSGGVRELRLYNQAMTDGQMEAVHNELREKWITSSETRPHLLHNLFDTALLTATRVEISGILK